MEAAKGRFRDTWREDGNERSPRCCRCRGYADDDAAKVYIYIDINVASTLPINMKYWTVINTKWSDLFALRLQKNTETFSEQNVETQQTLVNLERLTIHTHRPLSCDYVRKDALFDPDFRFWEIMVLFCTNLEPASALSGNHTSVSGLFGNHTSAFSDWLSRLLLYIHCHTLITSLEPKDQSIKNWWWKHLETPETFHPLMRSPELARGSHDLSTSNQSSEIEQWKHLVEQW